VFIILYIYIYILLSKFFLGQIWMNSNIGLKMLFKNVTQWLGLSIFDPNWVKTTQHFLEFSNVGLNMQFVESRK